MKNPQPDRLVTVQVTTWEPFGDKDILNWYAWLKGRGVPAALIHRSATRYCSDPKISVWRFINGEHGSREFMRPECTIVDECNGFKGLPVGRWGA